MQMSAETGVPTATEDLGIASSDIDLETEVNLNDPIARKTVHILTSVLVEMGEMPATRLQDFSDVGEPDAT